MADWLYMEFGEPLEVQDVCKEFFNPFMPGDFLD